MTTQGTDPRLGPRVSCPSLDSQPVQRRSNLLVRILPRHLSYYVDRVHVRTLAVPAWCSFFYPQLAMPSPTPVNHQYNLTAFGGDVGNDLLYQNPRDALLQSHVAGAVIP